MIHITRAQARQIRAVLRKSTPLGTPRAYRSPLAFHAGPEGLRVRGVYSDVAVEFHLPGPRPAAAMTLSGNALDDCEGKQDSIVVLTSKSPDLVEVCWHDGSLSQLREYPTVKPDKLAAFPDQPKKFVAMDERFLKALGEAAQTAARDSTRIVMNRLQLRGKTGEIVGTDGGQLLVQRGFVIPWQEDVVIPALGGFGSNELSDAGPVAIGRTATHVSIRAGVWTFHLQIDKEARFPRFERVIPAQFTKGTCLRIAPDDASFLIQELPRLPGGEDGQPQVTVDLNSHVAIRAKAEDETQATELVLIRSEATGPAVRFVSKRQFLMRAVRLGFTEFYVNRPDAPIVCRDRQRLYVWMPFNPESAIPSNKDLIRIESTANSDANTQQRTPVERKKTPMPTPQSNGHPTNGTPDAQASRGERSLSIVELITEAEELRTVVSDASVRLARLTTGLKQHRRQSRAVQAAMQSLQQLKLG